MKKKNKYDPSRFLFKIRDRTTGLFSEGGQYDKWSTIGKSWTTLRSLKSHVAMLRQDSKIIPVNWEIVVYEAISDTSIMIHDIKFLDLDAVIDIVKEIPNDAD